MNKRIFLYQLKMEIKTSSFEEKLKFICQISVCEFTVKKRKKMRSLWEERLGAKPLILLQGFPDTFFLPVSFADRVLN